MPELHLVRRLRQELFGMKKYLSVCRKASEQHFVLKYVDTLYLIDSPDMYSLQDLVDTNSGELPSKLGILVELFSTHIKSECEICQGRGHICEICSNNEVLYPFDATSIVCEKCYCVLHKHCYARKNNCPKCIRLKSRAEEEYNNNEGKDKIEE